MKRGNQFWGITLGCVAAAWASGSAARAADALILCPAYVPVKGVSNVNQAVIANEFKIGQGGSVAATWKAARVEKTSTPGKVRLVCKPDSSAKVTWAGNFGLSGTNLLIKAGTMKWLSNGYTFDYESINSPISCGSLSWTQLQPGGSTINSKNTGLFCPGHYERRCQARDGSVRGGFDLGKRLTTPPGQWANSSLGVTAVGCDVPMGTYGKGTGGSGVVVNAKVNYNTVASNLAIVQEVTGDYYINDAQTGFALRQTGGTAAPPVATFPDSEINGACPTGMSLYVSTNYLEPLPSNETKFSSSSITGSLTRTTGTLKLGSGSDVNFRNTVGFLGSSKTTCVASTPYDAALIEHTMQVTAGDGCVVNSGGYFQCSSRKGRIDCPTLNVLASPIGTNAASWKSGSATTVKATLSTRSSGAVLVCTFNKLLTSRGPTVVKK